MHDNLTYFKLFAYITQLTTAGLMFQACMRGTQVIDVLLQIHGLVKVDA